jgi:hypothetical protein
VSRNTVNGANWDFLLQNAIENVAGNTVTGARAGEAQHRGYNDSDRGKKSGFYHNRLT